MTGLVILLTALTLFAVQTLVVHRIIRLIIDDKITEPLRNWIYDKFGQPHNTWTYLFTCPWCISIWAAGLSITVMVLFPLVWLFFALILAVSSSASMTYIKFEDRA